MTGKMIARPNKNEFLLYSFLNCVGIERGDPDVHFLKRKTIDHFADYKPPQKLGKLNHYSKFVFFVLAHNDAPDYTLRADFDYGSLDDAQKSEFDGGCCFGRHLIHFYENTDFERFYQSILPFYEEECSFVQKLMEKTSLKEVVDEAWGLEEPFDIEAIPMPLEGIRSGVGPSLNRTSYPIFGPYFDRGVLHTIGHEASHPAAKVVLKQVRDHIQRLNLLMTFAKSHPNWPESYTNWQTCFEEHFIRAMQLGYIDPALGLRKDIEDSMEKERKNNGMVFIRDFFEEIQKYKKTGAGGLHTAVVNILDRLNERYAIQTEFRF